MKRYYRHTKWFYIRWGILFSLIVTITVAILLLSELDSVIQQKVQLSFQEKFTSATISISSARLEDEEGIHLNHFTLSAQSPKINSKDAPPSTYSEMHFPPVLEADRVILKCPTKIPDLLEENLPISEIIFDTAVVRTFRRPDGTWSLTALKTAPAKTNNYASTYIRLRNATFEIHDMMDTQSERKLLLRNVDMLIHPARSHQTDAQGKKLTEEEAQKNRYFPFQGTADCGFCKGIKFSGYFYPKIGMIRVNAEVTALQYSETFRHSLPLEIAEKLKPLESVRGEITGKISVITPLKNFSKTRFFVEGTMKEGRLEHPRLSQALTNIHTEFNVANDGYTLWNSSANYGEGQITSYTRQEGFHSQAKRQLQIRIRHLDLTERIHAILPEGIQNLLNDLRPTGCINADADMIYNGHTWSTTGEITCQDLSVFYKKFPYRVDKLNGKIELKGSDVSFLFKTHDKMIQVSGHASHGQNTSLQKDTPLSPPTQGSTQTSTFHENTITSDSIPGQQNIHGTVRIQALSIPIEERLIAACPEKITDLIRSLEMNGTLNVFSEHQFSFSQNLTSETASFIDTAPHSVTLQKSAASAQPKIDHRITLQLLNCSCRYKNFPYPLRNIQGTIEIHNDHFITRNIRGNNNNATVVLSCESRKNSLPASETNSDRDFSQNMASVLTSTSARVSSAVNLSGLPQVNETPEIPFTSHSKDSFPDFFDLHVTGKDVTLDDEFYKNLPPSVTGLFHYIQPHGTVNIHFSYNISQKKPRMEISVETPKNGITVTLPEIPYRLENFHGKFIYSDGNVSLQNFKARHGTSKISGKMHGKVYSRNSWKIHFEHLNIEGFSFDRDFLTAVPSQIRSSLASTRPTGMLFYRGNADIHYDASRQRPVLFYWKGETGITQGTIHVGFPLTNIHGGITTTGRWDGTDFYTYGEIHLDSLFHQKIQFTQIRGPIWIDNRQLLLGGDAARHIHHLKHPQTHPDAHVPRQAVSAKVLGGDAYGNFTLFFGDPSTFLFNSVITKAQLQECVSLTGNGKLKGNILATIDVQGNTNSIHSLRGSGKIHLSEADIYELPTMMALLKILSLKEVNRKGFSSGDLRYRIDGNLIYLDRIEFQGDAFSLIGKGEMGFDQKVRLIFYTVMGRGGVNIPILRDILHATGSQTLMLTMEGPLQNPIITQHPFPGLNMAIQQIEQDLLPNTPLQTIPNSSTPGWRNRRSSHLP
ncbi:MAG: hypothetical protein Q4C96_05660 [Planctomycetia bacterium]|nr:hypothetical protein [Planctomycetia bacterium]